MMSSKKTSAVASGGGFLVPGTHMKKNLLYLACQQNKKTVLLLALLETAGSLLMLASCFLLASIMQEAIQERTRFIASSAFLILMAAFIMRRLLHYTEISMLRSLSRSLQSSCRERLHAAALCRFVSTETGTPSREAAGFMDLALDACNSLDSYFTSALPEILQLTSAVPLMLCAALVLDPWTAVLYLVTLPLAPFLLYLIGRLTQKRSEEQWQKLQELSLGFHELLDGLVSLKIFGQSKAQAAVLTELSQGFSQSSLNVLQLAFASSFMLELLTTLSIAMVAVSIGLRLLAGSLDFFTAFFLLLITPLYYQPLRQAGNCFHALISAHTAEKKLLPYLGYAEDVQGKHSLLRLPPQISVKNLSFAYPGHHLPVLRNLSLIFPAGEATALTGPSGCGKSTLLEIMAGLCLPETGGVYLDEADLHRLDEASRQKLISYLPQEPHIFAATAAENVSLFQDVPLPRIEQALRLASMEKWLKELPHGTETKLGAGGLPLSHGEQKRLGLARIILQNRPLVLLDEPTAGLDEKTEAAVLRALEAFSRRRTLIIVTHRPAVLAWAKQIIRIGEAP